MTGYPTPVFDGLTLNGPLSASGGGTLAGTFAGSPVFSGAPQIGSGILGGSGRYDLKLSGAAGNGTTDDTAKIQAFLNTLLPGSTAVVPPSTFYLINSANLTIPNGITIEGGNPFSGWGSQSGPFAGCGFYLNPSYMIVLEDGCTLRNLKIYRPGLLASPTAAQIISAVSAWNSEVTIPATNADTPSGTTLPFASTTGVTVGQRVFGYNIANGTTVSAVTSTTVTLSLAVMGDVYSGQQIRFGASVGVYLQGNGGNVVSSGCLLEHLFIVGFNAGIQAGCGDFIINDVWADGIYGLDSTMAGDQCYVYKMRCEPWYGINNFATSNAGQRPGIAFWMHDGNTGGSLLDCFAFCWKTAYQFDNVQGIAATNCDCEDGLAQSGSRGWVIQNKTEIVVNGGTAIGFADVCMDFQSPSSSGGQPVISGLYTIAGNPSNGAYRFGANTQGLISNANFNANGQVGFHVQSGVAGPWRVINPLWPAGSPTNMALFDNPADGPNVFFIDSGFNGAFQLGFVDGTAAGGNGRGGQSVDLQFERSAATQVASGGQSAIVGGANNTASANWAVAGGKQNTVSGQNSVAFGYANTLSGVYSSAPGGAVATDDGRSGLLVWGSSVATGGYQTARQVFNTNTANATPTRMQVSDGNALDAANSFGIPDGKCCALRIVVTARNYNAQNAAVWVIDPAILYRTTGAASTTLTGGGSGIAPSRSVGTVTGWSIAVSADTTLGALNVTVTGAAATAIRWGASVEAMEVA